MKSIFITMLIISQFTLFSQNKTISGYVSDAETGERIINAVVYDSSGSNNTLTNNFGYFSLKISETDSVIITASYIGYKSVHKKVTEQIDFVNIELIPNNKIEEVTISADIPIEKRIETGTLEIPISQLKKLPAIGAEADIMKAYQLMPGIQSGNEGSSGLYVRGGSPDENLILLDDVPLYYVNHLGGFVSVFNTDALKNVSLIKGGFPARYGGRLSSIMNVRMKEGNMKEFKGSVSLGLIGSKISLEGPLKKDKISYIISARGFLWGFLMQPISKLVSNASVGYNFYDINAKINNRISPKDNLYFSFYKGDDNVIVRYKDKDQYSNVKANNILRWGNTLFAGRWNHVFNSRLFSNTILSYTKYRYASSIDYIDKNENQEYAYKFKTGIDDITLNSDYEYNLSPKYNIRFGLKNIYHKFSPGFSYYKLNSEEAKIDTSYGYNKIKAFESSIYLENEFKLGNYISGNIGIHASYYFVGKKGFFSPEPRAIINFRINKMSSLKFSYSEMQQNVHLLTSNIVSLPMDIWVPSTSELPPSKSKQYSAGFYKTMFNGKAELSIETYYKTSNNLIAYKEGATYRSVSENWVNKLETEGKGTSYGIEFLIQKKQGRLTAWIAYTYAKTNRKFKNINFGNTFPFKYDRRHDISLVAMYQINDKINISGAWVFGSGYPYTLPIGKYEAVNNGTSNIHFNNMPDIWYNEMIYTYANRNDYRMRTYHRLDLSINLKKEKKNGTRTWSINIYNAYNRQNPYYYFTKTKNSEVKLYQQSLFPIIPSISYTIDFKNNKNFKQKFKNWLYYE